MWAQEQAQAFRSQLPQNAAEYVRLNVLPRPNAAAATTADHRPTRRRRAPPGRGGAARAVCAAPAVAAEEGEVAVAAEGVGGAFGYLGGLAEGAAALAPTAGEVAGAMAATAGVGAAATAGLAVGLAGGAAYGLGRGRAGRPVRQQHERRHAAPALHAAHRQQHFGQPRKQPRLLAVWLQSRPFCLEDSPLPYERK